MDPIRARQLANIGVVSGLILAGFAVGGPIGAVAAGIGQEMLAGHVERRWGQLRDRLFPVKSLPQSALRSAMARAYSCAIDTLEREWEARVASEHKQQSGEARELFRQMREDGTSTLSSGSLTALFQDPRAVHQLGTEKNATRAAFRTYLNDRLMRVDPGLAIVVRERLEVHLAACFANELQTDDLAWREFQHLIQQETLALLNEIAAETSTTSQRLEEIAEAVERLSEWADRLNVTPVSERDLTGQDALETVLNAAKQEIVAAIERQGETLHRIDGTTGRILQAINAQGPAFDTVEQYFAPLMHQDRLFTHAFPLVGQQAHVEQLTALAQSDQRVAVLCGFPGMGKSRVLKEALDRIQTLPNHPTVVMLSAVDAAALSRPDPFPHGPVIVVLEDAHRHPDLVVLLQAARRHAGRVQLILTTRPVGRHMLERGLHDARFPPEEQLILPDLPPLSSPEMRQLAENVLGDDDDDFVDRLLAVTGDSPLVTVIGAQLLVNQQVKPEDLLNTEQARTLIFSRFEEVLVGKLSNQYSLETVRKALTLIATIGPLRPYHRATMDRVAAFIGVSYDDLTRLLDELQEVGALAHQSDGLRIVPDLLSDEVLKGAAVLPSGQPADFATEVFDALGGLFAGNILINLVDLLPELALQFVRTLVDASPGHGPEYRSLAAILRDEPEDPVASLPRVLQRLCANPNLRAEAMDLLWRLGRDDRREPNSSTDHPIRVLQDIAELEVGRDQDAYHALLDAIRRWIAEPEAFAHRISPTMFLDLLLEKEPHEYPNPGERIHYWDYPVSSETFQTVRERALRHLVRISQSDAPRAQYQALMSLLDALWTPYQLSTERFGADDQVARQRENRRILDAVTALLDRTKSATLACEVDRRFRRIIRKSGARADTAPYREILQGFPQTPDAKLVRYLWLGWGQFDFFDDAVDHEQRHQLIDQEIEEVVKQLVDQQPTASVLHDTLARHVQDILAFGVDASPAYVLETLVKHHPASALELASEIIERPRSSLVPYLHGLLIPLCERHRGETLALLEYAAASEDPLVLAAITQSLATVAELNEDERNIVRQLANRTEPGIALGVLECLQRFPVDALTEADEIAATVPLNGDPWLIDAYCAIYRKRGVDTLSPALLDAVLETLLSVGEISSARTEAHRLIEAVLQRDPDRVARFFLERIQIKSERRAQGEGDDYQPVPYTSSAEFDPGTARAEDRVKAMQRVIEYLMTARDDTYFWAVELFGVLAGSFDEPAVEVLRQLVDEEGPTGARIAGDLFRHAPDTFVFTQVDLMARLLEASESLDQPGKQRLRARLKDYALYSNQGVRPGQVPKKALDGRQAAAEIATALPAGGVARAFYEDLAREADQRIAAHERQALP